MLYCTFFQDGLNPVPTTTVKGGEMTPAQCKAARALLGWSQQDLADKAGLHKRTIAGFEAGEGREQHNSTEAALMGALEAGGAELIAENGGGPGVRLKRASRKAKRRN